MSALQVVAIHPEDCADGHQHAVAFRLHDGTELDVDELRPQIEAKSVYMYDLPTGKRRWLHFRPCPNCGEEVVWADS